MTYKPTDFKAFQMKGFYYALEQDPRANCAVNMA